MSKRRVVVTGLGVVTPLATGVQATWGRLINAECGIRRITQFDVSDLPAKIAGNVLRGKDEHGEFELDKWVDKRDQAHTPAFIQFALSAARQALDDARWQPTTDAEKERTGVAVGSGIGTLDEIVSTANTLQTSGYRKVSPHFIPKILVNMAAGRISLAHGLRGPNHACITACATGANALGDASRFIQYGDADVMVAGGTEACIHPLALAGFSRMRALASKFNDEPEKASRPFDEKRDGFVMGEGAGIVVLEEYEHAKQRGAKIYCELAGYGLSADAHHITAPSPIGDGAYRAMTSALRHAGLGVESVDYINAHATSTPMGDEIENRAIKRLFGDHAYKLAVSSTKGAVGHLLGAAGAVESVFAILALHTNTAPPTINLTATGDSELDLNYVPLTAQQRTINVALNNSFGFGGTNACLAFTKLSC